MDTKFEANVTRSQFCSVANQFSQVKARTNGMSIPPSLPVFGCFCLVFFYRCLSTMVGTFPLLSVQPTRGLVDEKIQVVVRNLPPALSVTLHSLHRSEDKDLWEAFGHYTSDGQGTVTGKVCDRRPGLQTVFLDVALA